MITHRSPYILRRLRALLWFVSIAPLWIWRVQWRGRKDPFFGGLVGLFRRVPGTITRRWGVWLWGLEIGDRGGARENVRHAMRIDPCPHAAFFDTNTFTCGTCGYRNPNVTIVPTRDEAIALAFEDAADGDEVEVHHETCAMRESRPCDCVPMVHVVQRGES